jgi:hypothetical protein
MGTEVLGAPDDFEVPTGAETVVWDVDDEDLAGETVVCDVEAKDLEDAVVVGMPGSAAVVEGVESGCSFDEVSPPDPPGITSESPTLRT